MMPSIISKNFKKYIDPHYLHSQNWFDTLWRACPKFQIQSILIGPNPGVNIIRLFTAVIYHHSMVIPSFCVIKLCYPENNYGMAVNYHGILTLEKVGLKYHGNLP
jgi:hypothetical protein